MSEAWRFTDKFTDKPCPSCDVRSLMSTKSPEWVKENESRYLWKGELECENCGAQYSAGFMMIEGKK